MSKIILDNRITLTQFTLGGFEVLLNDSEYGLLIHYGYDLSKPIMVKYVSSNYYVHIKVKFVKEG